MAVQSNNIYSNGNTWTYKAVYVVHCKHISANIFLKRNQLNRAVYVVHCKHISANKTLKKKSTESRFRSARDTLSSQFSFNLTVINDLLKV